MHIIKFGILSLASLSFSLIAFADAPNFVRDGALGDGAYSTKGSFDNMVGHTITIDANGTTGSYCVKDSNQCGRFVDIEFDDNGADITGTWLFNGSRGTFSWKFDFEDSNSFTGGFRMARGDEGTQYIPFDGIWNGRLNPR